MNGMRQSGRTPEVPPLPEAPLCRGLTDSPLSLGGVVCDACTFDGSQFGHICERVVGFEFYKLSMEARWYCSFDSDDFITRLGPPHTPYLSVWLGVGWLSGMEYMSSMNNAVEEM